MPTASKKGAKVDSTVKVTKPTKTAEKPPVEKKTTKAAAKKDDKPVAEVAKPVEEANVVVAVDSSPTVSDNFAEFMAKFQKMLSEFSLLKVELRTLEKKTMKELKVVTKLNNKRKKKNVQRAPSGFVKPTKISDELATFLNKPFGSEMARTDVTREINAYIRANSLQDKQNGRKINPDQSLAKLLKVTDKDELTYFNLQRYMSPHFYKKPVAEGASA
tara:strand:+ start:94 stop:744 length:651 start_codon:yes stop_codon:yes gene_type:complete